LSFRNLDHRQREWRTTELQIDSHLLGILVWRVIRSLRRGETHSLHLKHATADSVSGKKSCNAHRVGSECARKTETSDVAPT